MSQEYPGAGDLARYNNSTLYSKGNSSRVEENIRKLFTETPMKAAIVMDVGRSSLMAAILVCWPS